MKITGRSAVAYADAQRLPAAVPTWNGVVTRDVNAPAFHATVAVAAATPLRTRAAAPTAAKPVGATAQVPILVPEPPV